MEAYTETITTEKGKAILGATVTVYSGEALATIYSDDGVTPKSNPFESTAIGLVQFYAANGRYSVTISHPNYNGGVAVTVPVVLNDLTTSAEEAAASADADRIAAEAAHGAAETARVASEAAAAIAISGAGIKSIPTIAALRAMSGDYGGQLVKVAGYYAAGDGGGGPLRRWDAASTAADDGGAVIKPTAVSGAGRWVFTAKRISAADYGAKADGAFDNRAAFTAIAASGILDVDLDEGVYLFPRTANSIATNTGAVICQYNIRWHGKGKNKTILAEGQTVLTYTGNLFWLNENVSAEFNDLTIQGPTTEPTTGSAAPFLYGIHFMESSGETVVSLNNVSFTGWFVVNIQKSTGVGTGKFQMIFRHVEFNAYQCAIAAFAPNDIDGHVLAYDCIFWRATVPVGHPGYPFNHVLYIHPHINIHMERCRFVEWWGKFALHHYSEGGRTSSYAKYARFVDCRFEGLGAVFQQSDTIPLDLIRCSLENSVVASLLDVPGTKLIDCVVNKVPINDGISGSPLEVSGGTLTQGTGSLGWTHSYPGHWVIKGSRIIATTNNSIQLVEIKGTATKFTAVDCIFESLLTGTDRAISPISATAGTATINIVGGSISGIYGLYGTNGLFSAGGTFTGSAIVSNIDSTRLDAATSPLVSVVAATPANAVKVISSALGDSKIYVAVGGNYQSINPSSGLNVGVASNANLSITYQYDSYIVTGTTTIDNIKANADDKSQLGFCGKITLLAAGAWSTSAAGNIRPLTTAARVAGNVVVLVWNPLDSLWYEQ